MLPRKTALVIALLLLLSPSAILGIPSFAERASSLNHNFQLPETSPSITSLQICEVRGGAIQFSTCSSTALASDFTALYVSVTGLSPNSNAQISGSSGIPSAWTTAWNSQSISQCGSGASVCENGFYEASTGSSGSYSGYSYCSSADSYCSGSGQGAALAPAPGQYQIDVCTGSVCASSSITTASSSSTSTTKATSTTMSTTTSPTTTSTTSSFPVIRKPSACYGTNSGDFLYAANEFQNNISQYAVESNGQLCQIGPSFQLPQGTFPQSITYEESSQTFDTLGDAGGILVTSATSNCITGIGTDAGDGHLVYDEHVGFAGQCQYGSVADQPVGMATLSTVGGLHTTYVLNAGDSTMAVIPGDLWDYAAGSAHKIATLKNPLNIISDDFSFLNGPSCIFVDNQTMIQGYKAEFNGTYYLAPSSPISGNFGAMLQSITAATGSLSAQVLYALSPSTDSIYVFQVAYDCSLSQIQVQPTGVDPVSLVSVATDSIFVLNSDCCNDYQSTISSFEVSQNGTLTPVGSQTPAGYDSYLMQTDVGSLYGRFNGNSYDFLYVFDPGNLNTPETIDEYQVGGDYLPHYIGSVPSSEGVTGFVSGNGGCYNLFWKCNAFAYTEFTTFTIPSASDGIHYSYTIPMANGVDDSGETPNTMIYPPGYLPSGLKLYDNGTISGIPSAPGGNYLFAMEQKSSVSQLIGQFAIFVAGASGSSSQTTLTSTSGGQKTCKSACYPPGIHGEWATLNKTVNGAAEISPLKLNSTLTISWVDINANPEGQLIRDVAYNGSVLQVEFDKTGFITFTLKSSLNPTAIYADNEMLAAQSIGNESSLARAGYFYNKTSGIITISADPSSVTLFFNALPSTPTSVSSLSSSTATSPMASTTSTITSFNSAEFLVSIVVVVVVILGVVFAFRRRRQR